jgi:predicted ATPase
LSAGPVVPAISDPAQHRRRVFYSLSDLVAALAATSPLLVVVEDLHWSDETSLDFLADLARLLAVTAIAGQRFDFTPLQHLTQCDETAGTSIPPSTSEMRGCGYSPWDSRRV